MASDLPAMFKEVDEALCEAEHMPSCPEDVCNCFVGKAQYTLRRIAEAWPTDGYGTAGIPLYPTRRAILEALNGK